jgi:hypothetical protein
LIARNRSRGGRHWIVLDLQGASKSNRDAIGAEVTITAGNKQQRAQIKGAQFTVLPAIFVCISVGRMRGRSISSPFYGRRAMLETFRNLPINRVQRIVEQESR